MHCLLCHEKIPRLRHWRTKSEFCCDEHAAVHRRQTLERLVGSVAPADNNPVDPQARIAALAERSSASRPAAGPFDLQPESSPDAPEALEAALADAMHDAGEDAASGEPTWQDEQEPLEATTQETGSADRQLESAELADAAGEDEFLEEHASFEDELAAGDEGDEDLPYFEGTSVQHDEPFPVEIAPIESRDTAPSGPDISEPLEPALFERSTPSELTELSPLESSFVSRAHDEPSASADMGPEDTAPTEPQEVAQAGEPEASGETADTERTESQEPVEAAAAGPAPDGLDLSLLDDELPESPGVLEAAAELAELASEAETAGPEADAALPAAELPDREAATSAEEPGQKTVPSVSSGPDPQPKKAWDPTRPRGGKKKSSGRSTAGSEESLNRLAGQLMDRDSKLRAMGPGSEARRESKSKLVCFLPVQGGNGSSTVSLHVAEAISHHLKKRVLLADFDFHSGTLAFRLGLKPEHTFVDVFQWEQPESGPWDRVVCPWQQLDVLVAPPSNTSIHPQSMDRLPDILMSALRRYPYVIVDHPDAIYSSSRHILAMSDLVYLVCTPEITSLHLARRKVQQIRAMGVPGERLRLIVNRTGSWGSLGLEDVGKIAGVPVSWALMNDYAALRDAVWNGGLVQQGSGLARQLRELGWSIMGVDAQVAEESAAPAEVASSHP